MRVAILAILAILAAARPAAAGECDALRAHLVAEADRADAWSLGWGLGFTGVAIGLGAVAITSTAGTATREAAAITAAKATIGAADHWILPLRVAAPARASTCIELRVAVVDAARAERRALWLNALGGFAVNATGAIVLGELTTWRNAGLSFAIGAAVSAATIYTLPKASWRHGTAWSAAIVPRRAGTIATLARAF